MFVPYNYFDDNGVPSLDSPTAVYLKDTKFSRLRVVDLRKYPEIRKRISFLLGHLQFLTSPVSAVFYNSYIFGGAVRDVISGITSSESDIDIISQFPAELAIELTKSKRFVGTKKYLDFDPNEEGVEEILGKYNPISEVSEEAIYCGGWGGISNFSENIFESDLVAHVAASSQRFKEGNWSKTWRKIQVMGRRRVSQPSWSALPEAEWVEIADEMDRDEHLLRPVRMVDIICCGLALGMDSLLIEAVPGAFEDALNKRLRLNLQAEVSFKNTEARVERLLKRGYKADN
jgi:hypothetical protein